MEVAPACKSFHIDRMTTRVYQIVNDVHNSTCLCSLYSKLGKHKFVLRQKITRHPNMSCLRIWASMKSTLQTNLTNSVWFIHMVQRLSFSLGFRSVSAQSCHRDSKWHCFRAKDPSFKVFGNRPKLWTMFSHVNHRCISHNQSPESA